MDSKHTFDELNNYSKEQLISIVMGMRGQLDAMDEKLELLLEQIRIANSYRFGRKTEKFDQIDGQMSLFDEIDATADESVEEPEYEEVVVKRKKRSANRRP